MHIIEWHYGPGSATMRADSHTCMFGAEGEEPDSVDSLAAYHRLEAYLADRTSRCGDVFVTRREIVHA